MLNKKALKTIIWLLIGLSLVVGVFGAVLFTELGQLADMPSSWLYAIYPHLSWVSITLLLIMLLVIYVHIRWKLMSRGFLASYAVVMFGLVFITNFFVPNIWLRRHHHTAEYITVTEADALLDDEADVFVLEVDGDARAYPRDWMMLPHIAGDSVGGEQVTMTYCALSNLPLAFSSSIEGEDAHL